MIRLERLFPFILDLNLSIDLTSISKLLVPVLKFYIIKVYSNPIEKYYLIPIVIEIDSFS